MRSENNIRIRFTTNNATRAGLNFPDISSAELSIITSFLLWIFHTGRSLWTRSWKSITEDNSNWSISLMAARIIWQHNIAIEKLIEHTVTSLKYNTVPKMSFSKQTYQVYNPIKLWYVYYTLFFWADKYSCTFRAEMAKYEFCYLENEKNTKIWSYFPQLWSKRRHKRGWARKSSSTVSKSEIFLN